MRVERIVRLIHIQRPHQVQQQANPPDQSPHRRRRIHRQEPHRNNGRRRPLHKGQGQTGSDKYNASASPLNSPVIPQCRVHASQAARCHPDCLCVCENLPEDHPAGREDAHTLSLRSSASVERSSRQQQEEWDRRTDEEIERKKRADRAWKLAQFHEPEAKEDRRIEREEQRERRQQKREQQQQQEKAAQSRASEKPHIPRAPASTPGATTSSNKTAKPNNAPAAPNSFRHSRAGGNPVGQRMWGKPTHNSKLTTQNSQLHSQSAII